MTEEKKQDSGMQDQKIQPELNEAAMPTQDGDDQGQLFQAAGSDEVPAAKKRVTTRRKKQPAAAKKMDVAESIPAEEAVESIVAEEAVAALEQAPVAKRTRRTAVPKSQPERDVSSGDAASLQESVSEAPQAPVEEGLDEAARDSQVIGTDSGDAPKPTRRRATRKRAGAEESGEVLQQGAAELDGNLVKDKHQKKRSRGKPGSSETRSSQSASKVVALSFPESVARFVQHYHQVVTYLDDLSFRDALTKLHGQQSHWKPQLEEAISVFLDEALYVEEDMSLSKLRRAVATVSDLWGAAHAAAAHTQGQFMRAAQVVSRLMQSLGDIIQLDFVVPAALAEAFKPVQPPQVDKKTDTQVIGDELSDQEKAADSTPSSHAQQAEGGANTLLGVLQPFASSSAPNLLEESQKRFTGMASRARQYSQSGVAQSSSYGYLVGAFYAELTVMQLALLVCVERQQQQEKAVHHTYASHEAWTLLGQFKSELLPLIRATGVFSVDGDRRRGRGHTGMPASESLTALLATMGRSVFTASAEPNHNSQQHAGQGYFQPPDLD